MAYEQPTNSSITPKAWNFATKFFPFFWSNAIFSNTWVALLPSGEAWSLNPRLPKVAIIDWSCRMNSRMVKLRDWMDLAFLLQNLRTWATWLMISNNLDWMVVTLENKLVVFQPYHVGKDVILRAYAHEHENEQMSKIEFFLNILLALIKYFENIFWHMGQNIWWHGKILCHMFIDGRYLWMKMWMKTKWMNKRMHPWVVPLRMSHLDFPRLVKLF